AGMLRNAKRPPPRGVTAAAEVCVSPRTPGPSGRPSPGAGAPGSLGPGRGRSGARWAQPSTGTGESGCCCGTSCASELPCPAAPRSEEHTSELQSRENLVCRLLLEKKKTIITKIQSTQNGKVR